jgi:hypothetical protein
MKMSATRTAEPIRLVAIPEIARRGRACVMTVRRFVEKNGLLPDALLVTTGFRSPVQCFVEPRAAQIEKQLNDIHKTIS